MAEVLSCGNQLIELHKKSMDWLLYGRDLCRERVNQLPKKLKMGPHKIKKNMLK